MRECDVCLTTKPVELFTNISPTCNECVHDWWKTEGPGVRRKTNQRKPTEASLFKGDGFGYSELTKNRKRAYGRGEPT